MQDIRDECWVCNKWNYTIVYWSPTVQFAVTKTLRQDCEQQDDIDIEALRELMREVKPSKGPRIAGSFTNWEMHEMMPLIEFCEAVDTNKQDPIAILKKQGCIKEEIETEADLKTEKELRHLERVKEQIRQDYKQKWR